MSLLLLLTGSLYSRKYYNSPGYLRLAGGTSWVLEGTKSVSFEILAQESNTCTSAELTIT
jgi:hypothetical protein